MYYLPMYVKLNLILASWVKYLDFIRYTKHTQIYLHQSRQY
jgi:hypothetical protein